MKIKRHPLQLNKFVRKKKQLPQLIKPQQYCAGTRKLLPRPSATKELNSHTNSVWLQVKYRSKQDNKQGISPRKTFPAQQHIAVEHCSVQEPQGRQAMEEVGDGEGQRLLDLDGARGEVDADGGLGVEGEAVAGEAGEQVGLAHAGVADEHHLEEVVVLVAALLPRRRPAGHPSAPSFL
jgi:hypothetical protein